MGLEKKKESELNKELRKIGLSAFHIDCTIDGFPDTLVLGNFDHSMLLEYKQGSVSDLVKDAMEITQPARHRAILHQSNYRSIYTVLWDDRMDIYSMYRSSDLFWHFINPKARFYDYASVKVGDKKVIASYIAEKLLCQSQ